MAFWSFVCRVSAGLSFIGLLLLLMLLNAVTSL